MFRNYKGKAEYYNSMFHEMPYFALRWNLNEKHSV